MDSDLKPCPFCGGGAEEGTCDSGVGEAIIVACRHCGATGPFMDPPYLSREEAAQASVYACEQWNKRAARPLDDTDDTAIAAAAISLCFELYKNDLSFWTGSDLVAAALRDCLRFFGPARATIASYLKAAGLD